MWLFSPFVPSIVKNETIIDDIKGVDSSFYMMLNRKKKHPQIRKNNIFCIF